MAAQQQHQIDAQQQMMVAKEQRLKYLKQQEQRHEHASTDRDRLAALRRSVHAQEMKLSKLRALHGHIDRNTVNNNNLGTFLLTTIVHISLYILHFINLFGRAGSNSKRAIATC